MLLRLVALLGLALLLVGPAAAQDPVEFDRLSADQKQLAEQVRRLEKILLTLEDRERAEGADARAELLREAREKLVRGAQERPLASVLEEVAADLSDLRAGDALERQAELIRFLEELLDFLLETERREQVQDLMDQARQREAELRALAQRQADLRARTEELERREAAHGEVDEAARRELAQEQADLNEDIRAAAERDRNASGADDAARAAQEGEQAESALDPARAEQGEIGQPGEAGENAEPGEAGEQPEGAQPQEGGEPNETGQPGERGEQPENAQPGERGEQPEGAQPGETGEQPEQSQPREGGEQPEGNQPQEGGERPENAPPREGGAPPEGDQPRENRPPADSQSPSQRPSNQPPRSPQESLEDAQEHQRRAEEELQRGADEAAEEAERLGEVDELETLINVLEKAEELLARHERVVREYGELVASLDGSSRVPRSARVELRRWATEQRGIAEEAGSLLFEIREAGADSFPFLLQGLVDDHGLLAQRIGPPKYRADVGSTELAARILRDWQRLVDAITIEAERLRKKIEQPQEESGEGGEQNPGGDAQPQPPQPLVSLAAELQLLKQLQQDLLDRMSSLQRRRALLAEAGIELDEDDLAELEAVVQRQKRLRSLFERILERLQESETSGEEI